MWKTASQAAASKPVRNAAPYPRLRGCDTTRTRRPGAAALAARSAVSSVLPSSTTSTSKSLTPSAASASPVRRTVFAITASSLYAGRTALIVGRPRSAGIGSGTSGSSTDVVDDDVIATRNDRVSLVRPPQHVRVGVNGAGVVEPVVDLDVADAVLAQQAGDRACRRLVRAAAIHGLDVRVASPEVDAVAPEPSAVAHHAEATRDREDRVVGTSKGEHHRSLRGRVLGGCGKLNLLCRCDGVWTGDRVRRWGPGQETYHHERPGQQHRTDQYDRGDSGAP